MTKLWVRTLDLFECQTRACGDDQIVIIDCFTILQLQPVTGGIDSLATFTDKSNPLALQVRTYVDGDTLPVSPTDRNPGIRGHKLKIIPFIDYSHLMCCCEHLTNFIGTGHATCACTENYDMRHRFFLRPEASAGKRAV